MVSNTRLLLLLVASGAAFLPATARCASRTRVASISVTVQVVSSCTVSAPRAQVLRASDVRVACGAETGYAVSLERGTLLAPASDDARPIRSIDGLTATITY